MFSPVAPFLAIRVRYIIFKHAILEKQTHLPRKFKAGYATNGIGVRLSNYLSIHYRSIHYD